MRNTSRLYSAFVVVLIAGLVMLAAVLLLGSGLGAWGQPATVVTLVPSPEPTQIPAVTLTPTDVPTSTPEPSPTARPTSTSVPTATPTATPEVPTPTPESTETPVPTESPQVTDILTETAAAVPPVVATRPVDPSSPFHGRTWVGLYGTCLGRGLGILGTAPATETVSMVVQQALAYQELTTVTEIIPFFHMVVTIADPHPGPDGDYVHRVATDTVQLWVDVASRHGLLSVLDIQPGYSPLASELAYVEPFLRQPGVHVAIDPEFLMLDGVSVPGEKIGSMTGALVNEVQAWLSEVAAAVGEPKVLIIHQFDDRMFSGKEEIVAYPLVDLVWDADGFGGPGAKIGDYNQYAGEPGFEYGGFKLFYNYDVPVMTPAQVMGLVPLPAFVVYQ